MGTVCHTSDLPEGAQEASELFSSNFCYSCWNFICVLDNIFSSSLHSRLKTEVVDLFKRQFEEEGERQQNDLC